MGGASLQLLPRRGLDHWSLVCWQLWPIILHPTSMSCLRQRKYQSQTVGRRAPQDCPALSQAVAEKYKEGCEAVSDGSRHSELVGVTRSLRHGRENGRE